MWDGIACSLQYAVDSPEIVKIFDFEIISRISAGQAEKLFPTGWFFGLSITQVQDG